MTACLINIREKINKRSFYPFVLVGSVIAFSWLVLSHSWFSDDAYFSFRTVDNFVNGYGLTWNVSERVQVFTNPLWVLVLSIPYYFTGEIYLTSIFTSLIFTIAILLIVYFGIAKKASTGLLAIFLLSLSTSFIDYSSSGLENPLSHFFLALFALVFISSRVEKNPLLWLSLITSFAAINRLDTILFYLPAIAYEFWIQADRKKALAAIMLGFAPLAAWELFSIIYYGFPFPNTYYAKTQNYIPQKELIFWGFNYFKFTALFDPITWVGILAGTLGALWARRRKGIAVALGVLLYLIYVIAVGGDFMGGRFLSAAYLAGILLLLRYVFPRMKASISLVIVLVSLIISLSGSSPPYFLYPRNFEKTRLPESGNIVVDERMEFYTTNFVRLKYFYNFNSDPNHNHLNNLAFLVRSIFRGTAFRTEPEHDWIDLGLSLRQQAEAEGAFVSLVGATGFTGFSAGPDVHFIQSLALTDAFLARIPPLYSPNWRIAHFTRLIPEGYPEAAEGLQQGINDEEIDPYFRKITLVTQGELFSSRRFQYIWELNTRNFEDLFPQRMAEFRYPHLVTLPFAHLETEDVAFSGIDFSGCCGTGLQINFANPVHYSTVKLDLSSGDNFRLSAIREDGIPIWSTDLISQGQSVTETFHVDLPRGIQQSGFIAIRIIPTRAGHQLADAEYYFYSARFFE